MFVALKPNPCFAWAETLVGPVRIPLLRRTRIAAITAVGADSGAIRFQNCTNLLFLNTFSFFVKSD
jgi:hypothetical protein